MATYLMFAALVCGFAGSMLSVFATGNVPALYALALMAITCIVAVDIGRMNARQIPDSSCGIQASSAH